MCVGPCRPITRYQGLLRAQLSSPKDARVGQCQEVSSLTASAAGKHQRRCSLLQSAEGRSTAHAASPLTSTPFSALLFH